MKSLELNFKIKISHFLFVVFAVSVFSFSFCQAAVLYLELPNEDFHKNDVFLAEIRLNTEGEYINAVKVELSFPQDILKIEDFSKGNSILTVWAEEPEFSNQNGTISFSGGTPGGYQGWNGILGKIVLKAIEQGIVKIEFQENSQALLNDGLGTPANLKIEGVVLNILIEDQDGAKNQWLDEIIEDIIPPEPFEIEISRDPDIFDGKYFIIFSTTDKRTGIDYYEAKEGESEWNRVQSPYVLENQDLTSIITVRVVDKGGNERIAELGPRYIPSEKVSPWWVTIIILIVIGVGYWVYRILKCNIKK